MTRYEIALGKPPPPPEPPPEIEIPGNKYLLLGARRSGKTSVLMQDCLRELWANKKIVYVGSHANVVDYFMRMVRDNSDYNLAQLHGVTWRSFVNGLRGYIPDVAYFDDIDTFGDYNGHYGVNNLVDQIRLRLGYRFDETKIMVSCSSGSVAVLPHSRVVYHIGGYSWRYHSL